MTTLSNDLLNTFTGSRTEPNIANRFSSEQKIEMSERTSSFVQTSDVDITAGNWVALTDTVSDVRTITLAQVEDNLLDNITSKLSELGDLVASIENIPENSDQYNLAITQFDELEAEISALIGLSTIKATATFLADPDTGNFEVKNTGSYVDVLSISDRYGDTTDIAVIEMSQRDFLNGYHLPDGCPICAAQVASENNTETVEPSVLLTSGETSASSETPSNGPSTVDGNVTGLAYDASFSGTDIVDTLDSNYRWDISADETLTYSFYDASVGLSYDDWTPYEMGAEREAELRVAYETWDVFLPFQLEEVEESGNTVGELRSMYNDLNSYGAAGSAAQGAYPFSNAAAGDSYFHQYYDAQGNLESGLSSNRDFTPGTYGFLTALHEYGHNLGIRHPFGNSDSELENNGNLPTEQEDHRYSIMAYSSVNDQKVTFSGDSSSYSYSGSNVVPITPMVYDLMAVHDWYGSPTDASTGDSTFTFTDPDQIQTLIDSEGTDTIDLSGMEQRSIVDLTPGAYSSLGYWSEADQVSHWASTIGISSATVQSVYDIYTPISSSGPNISGGYTRSGGLYERQDNLGIAEGTIIENVVGSAGDDEITGNTAGNTITGNAGNDVIDGGDGSDTAVFRGNIADYTIVDNGDGTRTVTDSVAGRDGMDTLSNVENLRFADSGYDVAAGRSVGDANYRGGSNGGGVSNVYYSAFNRVDLSSRVMAPHEIAELKELLYNSVGDVSDLIEEALKSFASQKASMTSVLDRLGSSITTTAPLNMSAGNASQSSEAVAIAREEASALASELKQELLKNVGQTVQAQQPPAVNQIQSLLA